MAWYEFSQNNSGGSFVVNEELTHRIFIEANSEEEAINKALELGIYFHGVINGYDCECCGDRWSSYDPTLIEFPKKRGDLIFNSIEEYAQYMANHYGWCAPDAYIYYLNGDKKSISKTKSN